MQKKETNKDSRLKNFFKSFTTKQLIWFVIGLCFFISGIVLIVLNIVGESINMAPSKNPILIGNGKLKTFLWGFFGFLNLGIFLILAGGTILAIALSLASKNEDREKERQSRRKQRLQQMMDNEVEDAIIVTSVNEETEKKN